MKKHPSEKTKKTVTEVHDSGSFPDRVIFFGLVSLWGIIVFYAAATLLQPDWLFALSVPGRTVEAQTLIDEGNAYLYGTKGTKDNKRFEKALELYNNALKIDTGNYVALANSGIALLYLNKLEEARTVFELCLVKDTASAWRSYGYLGDYYERKYDHLKALEHYVLSIKKHPFPAYPLRKAGLYSLKLGYLDDALLYLQEAIKTEKSLALYYRKTLFDALKTVADSDNLIALNTIKEKLADTSESPDIVKFDELSYSKSLIGNAELGNAYMYLGDVYDLKGQFALALEAYNSAQLYYNSYNEALSKKIAFVSQKLR